MIFQVMFTRAGGGEIVAIKQKDAGLALLRVARAESGASQLLCDRVSEITPLRYEFHIIVEIEEAEAIEAGLFEETYRREVSVSCCLNDYVDLVAHVRTQLDTGEVLEVAWGYRVNEKRLLDDWKADGFPTEWELEEASE